VWNVIAANELAQRIGIELGMARTLAEEFENVMIRLRSRVQEKAAHAALLDLGWSVSPRVEDTAPDTIVLDLGGLSTLFGAEESVARQLAERASALGLTANVAVASNLQVAIHAARGFAGVTWIAPNEEAKRLGCLSVSVLGPSAETLETLDRWGVRTCGDLSALPVLSLSERLGQEGVQLHTWARGVGNRAMVLAEPGICFEEGIELDDSVEELDPLAFLLNRLLQQLCARLKARSLAFQAIHLRFELDLSGKNERQIRNEHPRAENKAGVYETILMLPVPMLDGKMLLNLLRLKLQEDPPASPIQKILMVAEPSRPRSIQKGLFQPVFPDPEKLELTITKLAHLVGHSNIGSPQLVDTHHPGEFCMDRFVPALRDESKAQRGDEGVLNEAKQRETNEVDATKTVLGFRIFRPSMPANVQLEQNRPRRVSFMHGRGEVVTASGPWRTSGDWWNEQVWYQDEWDLEIRFQVISNRLDRRRTNCPSQGLYRFYYDSIRKGWFVRGIYD
jgi:protein ImuB